MTITPRFLDDLRARLTLSEVVGRRVKITRAGREFKACCPFHKEKSPSFYINDDKQFFHCFGCGAHGDVVGFTMRHDNLSFIEAVEALAPQAGLQMPAQHPEDIERAKTEKSLYALMDDMAKWFEAQLHDPHNREVMEYITKRGLTPDTIAGFRLGYAPADDQKLRTHMLSLGHTDEELLTMGLIKKRERDGSPYAFFRDRVMFPVADRAGRVIAFGGRILPEHMRPPQKSDFKPPKYINSPETPLFYKGQTVYALAQARQAANDGQGIVVVEGYMDVIAMHQAGFRGAVAPLGTALTEEQMTLLWRLMPQQQKIITLCFDGDNAGRRAAERAAERMLPLLKPDHSARIVFLPDGEDPDTMVLSKGAGAMTALLQSGISLADYIWQLQSSTRGLNGPEDRAGLEADLDALVNKITEAKTKYHYQQFFRQKLQERFRPAPRPYGGPQGRFAAPPAIKPASRPQSMQTRVYDILLATLLNHPFIFGQVDEQIGSLVIADAGRDALRHALIDALSDDPDLSREDLLARLTGEGSELTDVIHNVVSDSVYVHARFARPEADDPQAADGWLDTYAQLQRRAQLDERASSRK